MHSHRDLLSSRQLSYDTLCGTLVGIKNIDTVVKCASCTSRINNEGDIESIVERKLAAAILEDRAEDVFDWRLCTSFAGYRRPCVECEWTCDLKHLWLISCAHRTLSKLNPRSAKNTEYQSFQGTGA